MEHIGQRIKDLRKKADLTQDRLADYLGVSAQAVSKWECGIATPDLALIAPLCKVLGCSADEMLGVAYTEDKERAKALYNELDSLTPEDGERFAALIEEARRDFPRNEKISFCIAQQEYWFFGGEKAETDEGRRRKDDAEKRLLAILSDGRDEQQREYAASQLFHMRMNDGLREEAKAFAEQSGPFREELLLECLDGDEWRKQQQFLVYKSLNWLCNYLDKRGGHERHLPSYEAIDAVVRTVISDGNYVGFSNRLFHNAMEMIPLLIEEGAYDRAVEKIRDAADYAVQDAALIRRSREPGDIPYTAPALDGWSETGKRIVAARFADAFFELECLINGCRFSPIYAPLRDREDFKALIAELESKADEEQEETV